MFHRNRITRHSDSNDIRTSSIHVIEKSHYWCFTEETLGITVSVTKISRNKFGGAAIITGRRQVRGGGREKEREVRMTKIHEASNRSNAFEFRGTETCYNKRSGKFDVGRLPKILSQVEYLTSFPNGTFAAKPLAEIRMQDVKRKKSATTGVNSTSCTRLPSSLRSPRRYSVSGANAVSIHGHNGDTR
ncbi:hypothetical protein ALC53_02928 [Atta colombica]|uniref:Uncharacterized protein n=1 Tax=Atta colombica TaxID=520822 RepID=A0A195BPK8_9HYME|nr:hypothetical protein ALC53_02928 [Atta colombica]